MTFRKDLAWRWAHFSYVCRSLSYLLKPTPARIRHYFEHGKRTHWTTIEAGPWSEHPNDLDYHSTIVGIANNDEMFRMGMTISNLEVVASKSPWEASELASSQMMQGLAAINMFLDPHCYCKLGPHWGCSIHGTWFH